MSSMKKVLVTGATGFVGSHLVRRLLSEGCHVIASSAHPERAVPQDWFSRVEYISFDLSSFDASADLFQLLGSPDKMIHLAWEGLPNYRAPFHLEVNLPRHTAFLENIIRHGLSDLTVTGTCLEYGMQEGCLAEDGPAYPDNPYAIAKNHLRIALEQLQRQYPFRLKWARLFYMYGRGQNPNSLFSQLDKALEAGDKVFNMSGGQQVRDYLPVEMVAEYLYRIAFAQKTTGIINCCSGHPVTVQEMVEDYLQKKHRSIPLNLGFYAYPDYEPFRFWGDNSKLKTILNE